MEIKQALADTTSVALTGTFLGAAVGKTLAMRRFRQAIAAFRFVGHDPDSQSVKLTAILVITAEAGLGLGLAAAASERWMIAAFGVLLLTVFSVGVWRVIRSGEDVHCSCFGLLAEPQSEAVSSFHLARNTLVALLLVPAASAGPISDVVISGLGYLAVVVLAGLCLSLLIADLPTLLKVAFYQEWRLGGFTQRGGAT